MNTVPLQEFKAVQDACEEFRAENKRLLGVCKDKTEMLVDAYAQVARLKRQISALTAGRRE